MKNKSSVYTIVLIYAYIVEYWHIYHSVNFKNESSIYKFILLKCYTI